MTSYFSLLYLGIFLPAVVLLYSVFPQKHRWKVLLGASYLFFWSISGKLVLYLVYSTCSIHYFGLWMASIQSERDRLLAETEKQNKKTVKAKYQKKLRQIVTVAVILQIGVLLVLKYAEFFGSNLNSLLALVKAPFTLPIPEYILPIGISFYTLQAASYLFDVYRGTVRADKNFFRLALFLSFFPQIMEGPICRYNQTCVQLWEGKKIEFTNLVSGCQRILYGLMKKVVVADRLNIFIQTVFSEFDQHDGGVTAVAMVLYTCQLYMDFSGTMDCVLGTAEIFGVNLPENFKQPFFSKSISDFWTRWHITLGTWFRDYIFYPVSMSKPLKRLTVSARKRLGNHFGPLLAGAIALFCVWICNGLWHGAGWKYIFFGMYHFALILTANIMEPFIKTCAEKLHINRQSTAYRCVQVVKTSVLVCFGELFFRAHGLRAGLYMFRNIFTSFSLETLKDRSIFKLGMDIQDFIIVFVAVFIVFVIGILRERGIHVRESLSKKNTAVRWAVSYALILFIIIFGAYGAGYIPVEPIYANF